MAIQQIMSINGGLVVIELIKDERGKITGHSVESKVKTRYRLEINSTEKITRTIDESARQEFASELDEENLEIRVTLDRGQFA